MEPSTFSPKHSTSLRSWYPFAASQGLPLCSCGDCLTLEQESDDDDQKEVMFHLYFSWAFALQEKGKQEYLRT